MVDLCLLLSQLYFHVLANFSVFYFLTSLLYFSFSISKGPLHLHFIPLLFVFGDTLIIFFSFPTCRFIVIFQITGASSILILLLFYLFLISLFDSRVLSHHNSLFLCFVYILERGANKGAERIRNRGKKGGKL